MFLMGTIINVIERHLRKKQNREKSTRFERPSKIQVTHSFLRERRKNYWRSLGTSRPEADDEAAVVDAVGAEDVS